jgi:phosphopantetheine adenylyltransferase/dephospho-CoA kinase
MWAAENRQQTVIHMDAFSVECYQFYVHKNECMHIASIQAPMSIPLSNMYIIGVTGGICAGKSTVVRVLHDLGATVVDADKLGHKAYEPNTECFRKLVEHFGDSIVDENGEINRRALGSIVFSDPGQKAQLQNIVWPEIRKLIVSTLREFQSEGKAVVVLEAAVMIEAGWQDLVSCLWAINVNRDIALRRLVTRNGLSEEEGLKRIQGQLSNEERSEHADLVIDNSTGTVDDLERIVRAAYLSLPISS